MSIGGLNMYYCNNCKREFESFKKLTETHNLDNPPFENTYVCPFCESADVKETVITHCRYCGAKLRGEQKIYCSDDCKTKGMIIWKRQMSKQKHLIESPLYSIVRELDNYNKINNKKLSYGQYVAIVKGEKKNV